MINNINFNLNRKKYDALVVLGKNIGVDWGPEEIKNQEFHLSDHARINVLAAGLLYSNGYTNKIIFSSGETVKGYNEAHLMKDFLMESFDGKIPDEAVILEDKSKDTQGNAAEVKKIVDRLNFKTIGLVTVGFHLPRAEMLFKKQGLCVDQINSEDIIATKFPKNVEKYKNSDLYIKEVEKENTAKKIQSIPILGTIASIAVNIKRSLNS